MRPNNMVIIDFSKAFDTVPHKKILHKMKLYGVDGKINDWLIDFLTNRKMRLVVDGEESDAVTSTPDPSRHCPWPTPILMPYKRPLSEVNSQIVCRRLLPISSHYKCRWPHSTTEGPPAT